jgi:flagellar basal body-associated protein FliL
LLFPFRMASAQKAGAGTEPSRIGIVFSVLGMVALLALGAGLWSMQRNRPPAPGTLHLETFILNLADPEQRSYLRVGIDLGLRREIPRGENAPVGEIRDTIVGVLAQSRVEELLTAQGKLKLKADLLRALQERIPKLGVEEVYFTEFLIQR